MRRSSEADAQRTESSPAQRRAFGNNAINAPHVLLANGSQAHHLERKREGQRAIGKPSPFQFAKIKHVSFDMCGVLFSIVFISALSLSLNACV